MVDLHDDDNCDIRNLSSSVICEFRDRSFCAFRNNADMKADRDIVRGWLNEHLRRAGRGARGALAQHLGLRADAISRMTGSNEDRDISGPELLRAAEFFNAPLPLLPRRKVLWEGPALKIVKTNPPPLQPNNIVPLMGYIGAGAEILPDFEQVPPEGLRDIELPFPVPDDLIGLQVTGRSMFPRYEDGDVIIVWREQRTSLQALIGEEAAIKTFEGRRYLKQILAGKKRGTFDLKSLNEDDTGLIAGVTIEWASEIYATVRAAQLQRVARRQAAAQRTGRTRAR